MEILWVQLTKEGIKFGLDGGPVHNYQIKLEQMIAQGAIPAVGHTGVNVFHDDWCAVFRDGRCDCDPDIELVSDEKEVKNND